jgi:hypothetical protein
MNMEQLSNSLVKRAIVALNSGDRAAWFGLFTQDATLTDDGNKQDFVKWSDSEIFGRGQGRLINVKREENNGLTVYGTFRSAQWGTFETVFKFHESGGRLSGLDVAQINTG